MTFNDDTTTYARRYSNDGGADITSINESSIDLTSHSTKPAFSNMFIINNLANEKLVIAHLVDQNTAGAGTAPNRSEITAKWDNTSSQITKIDIDLSSGNMGTDTILKVWGSN